MRKTTSECPVSSSPARHIALLHTKTGTYRPFAGGGLALKSVLWSPDQPLAIRAV
jgi:hypothetical protein